MPSGPPGGPGPVVTTTAHHAATEPGKCRMEREMTREGRVPDTVAEEPRDNKRVAIIH